MRKVNLDAAQVEYDDSRPVGYQRGAVRLGPQLGAEVLGATVYELPPGESVCPYHYEYGDEEWLIVVAGTPTVRHPDGESELEAGDVVAFPRGPKGAHKVGNTSGETARVLIISTLQEPSVAVYPDSDKIGVYQGEESLLVRRESGVDYWDREQ